MTTDPYQLLFRHFDWATRQVIDACRALDAVQLDRKFEMGVGSLIANLDHIVWAVEGWCDRLEGNPWRPDDDGPHTLDSITARLDDVGRRWNALLDADRAAGRLESPLTYDIERPPGTVTRRTLPRSAVYVHTMTHGFHHRAQCVNMLRQIGVKLPMQLDLCFWQWRTELPPETIKQRCG